MTSRDAIVEAVYSLYDNKAKHARVSNIALKQIQRDDLIKHFKKIIEIMRQTHKVIVA